MYRSPRILICHWRWLRQADDATSKWYYQSNIYRKTSLCTLAFVIYDHNISYYWTMLVWIFEKSGVKYLVFLIQYCWLQNNDFSLTSYYWSNVGFGNILDDHSTCFIVVLCRENMFFFILRLWFLWTIFHYLQGLLLIWFFYPLFLLPSLILFSIWTLYSMEWLLLYIWILIAYSGNS
jgi:hypothetical protein